MNMLRSSCVMLLVVSNFTGMTTVVRGEDVAPDTKTEETGADANSTSSAPAPTASAPEVSATEPKKEAKEGASEHYGLFGPLRIGPTASVGFPFLLNYGVDATWERTIGAGFGLGRMKRDVNSTTKIELFNWDMRLRWFPWQGSFFLGAAYGNQNIVGQTTQDVAMDSGGVPLTIPTTLRLEVKTTYLTPHLGWFSTWDCGFTLGFELGYQMPLSSKAELQQAFENVSVAAEDSVTNSESFKKTKSDIEKVAETFGKKAVPYINLIRIGWLL